MSCAPHVPLPDVPAEAADAEDEGGDVSGRLEDLPVRIYEVDRIPSAVGVRGE